MPAAAGANRFAIVSVALVIGGAIIGIVTPILLIRLGIKSTEIAPGFDLLTVVLPVVGFVDWALAWFFWRANRRAESPDRPVVG